MDQESRIWRVSAYSRKKGGKHLQTIYIRAKTFDGADEAGGKILKWMGNKNFRTSTSLWNPIHDPAFGTYIRRIER